jgi:hypothetical protein
MKRRPHHFSVDECARHEAGHAIARVALKFGDLEKMRAIVLDEPDAEGTFGYVEHYPGQYERDREEPPAPKKRRLIRKELWEEDPKLAHLIDEGARLHLARQLIVSHAGAISQFPRQHCAESYIGASKDMRNCDEAAWEVGYWPPHQWDMAYFAACAVIDERFGELMALSRVLARRRRLMGSEILEIVARAPKRPNPYRSRVPLLGAEPPEEFLAAALVTWRDPPMLEWREETWRPAAMSEEGSRAISMGATRSPSGSVLRSQPAGRACTSHARAGSLIVGMLGGVLPTHFPRGSPKGAPFG